VLLVVLLLGLLIGIGGELLTSVSAFGEPPGTGFAYGGSRLGQVPVRTLAVFVLAVGVGTLVPRQLPALLLGGIASLVLAGGLTMGMDAWMHASAVPIPYDQGCEAGSRLLSRDLARTGAIQAAGQLQCDPLLPLAKGTRT
jgi:hypothetical protein